MGERIGRIRQIGTDFFDFLLKSVHLNPKNPFQSAKSAQSVFPLYRFFPKLQQKEFKNVSIQKVFGHLLSFIKKFK
jgi:hypothetical protein